jgi:hypothetical protein
MAPTYRLTRGATAERDAPPLPLPCEEAVRGHCGTVPHRQAANEARPWLCRESTIIVVGLISLLAVVTLRQDLAGAAGSDRATLDVVGRALVAIKDGTLLLGPAYCAGLGNGLLLGYLMYRSGLVPRRMALLGVIGGPLSVVGATCVLFGAWEQTSATQFIFTIPEIAWEASLGIYLIVKGFRPSPILDDARYTGGNWGSLRPAAAAP